MLFIVKIERVLEKDFDSILVILNLLVFKVTTMLYIEHHSISVC